MKTRELAIIKAALEGDIIRQKKSPNADHEDFKLWLKDSEKLLKKVSLKLMEEERNRFYRGE